MTTFALTDEHARMGKISNNLEKHGEDDLITGFTLPLELNIPRPQLVGFMGKDFDASAWKSDNTPADWLRRVLPMELAGEVYVGVQAELVLNEDLAELTFEDCRVTHVTLVAFAPGGSVIVSCHLYLRPGIGNENLLLQEYQGKEIAVQLTSGKLRVKADKAQQQLPLEQPAPKTERELAFERGEEVEVITTVVDGVVTHQHPSFNGGTVSHGQSVACVVCNNAEFTEPLPDAGIPPADADQIAAIELEDAIGTPEEEREKARLREVAIAQQLADAHENGDGPGDDDDGDEDEGEMSELGQQIGNADRKGPQRAKRRSTVTGDAVN